MPRPSWWPNAKTQLNLVKGSQKGEEEEEKNLVFIFELFDWKCENSFLLIILIRIIRLIIR